MNLDEQLRQSLATLTDRLREEAEKQVSEATEALVASAEAEQAAAVAKAAADARAIAEQAAAEMLANAEERALRQGREQGMAEGRQLGRNESLEEGLRRGRGEGLAEAEERVRGARDEGYATGLVEGRKDGHAAGLEEGREQGRNEGFEKGLEEGQARGRQLGREEGLSEGRAEGRNEGLAEGRTEGIELGLARARQDASAQRQADSLAAAASMPETDTGERLLESLRLIDDAGSLSSILDALTTSASRESARVGVLLVTGDQLRSWRFVGFGSALDEASGVELSVAESGVIGEAVRTRGIAFGDSANASGTPSFANLPPGRQMLAVPVAFSGQVVAVLYADQGSDQEGGDETLSVHTLDALARHAARCLESVTAVRAVQLATGGARLGAGTP